MKCLIIFLTISLALAQSTITSAEWQEFLRQNRENTRRLDRVEVMLAEAGSSMKTGQNLYVGGLILQVIGGTIFTIIISDGDINDNEDGWAIASLSIAGLGSLLGVIGIIVTGSAGNKLKKAVR